MVEWKGSHIDLGREASIVHSIFTAQLKAVTLTDPMRHAIQPLAIILEGITRAGEEDEGDPLTATFEALRAMQSTISEFQPSTGGGGENSGSSSEYTTPAQSQTTSPLHEISPPPPGLSMQVASATVGSAAKLLTMQNSGSGEPQNSSSSPTTSPTHCERVSSLATHSHHAAGGKSHSRSHSGAGTRYRTSASTAAETVLLDVPANPRRKSDSELQRQKVRPVSQGGTIGDPASKQNYSKSIDHVIK